MLIFTRSFLLCGLITLASALPQLHIPRNEAYVHPFVRTSQTVSPKTFGTPPKVVLLEKSDLLDPQTVVPGFSVPTSSRALLKERGIIGTDNRFLQTKTGNPWDHIGSFARSDGGRCSGSLVGPRHLATARHCYDNTPGSKATYQFRPNYDQGTRGYTTAGTTTVLYISSDSADKCFGETDWAIFILDQRLGDKYGYFGARNFNATKANQAIFWHEASYAYQSADCVVADFARILGLTVRLGYPVDLANTERPYAQNSITGKQVTDCKDSTISPITTNADAVGGQSGGPLWLLPESDGVRYLYGVLSGGSDVETIFAGRAPLVNAIAQARQNYP